MTLYSQVLVGNKSDMEDKRAVPYSKGKALADEFGFRFFETSAKDNLNVAEVGQEQSLHVRPPSVTAKDVMVARYQDAHVHARYALLVYCAGFQGDT